MKDQSPQPPPLPAPIPVAGGEGTPPGATTRTVVAGAVGNVLEWYDFGLFGYFGPVISRLFFPSDRVGRKPMILNAALCYALLSYPLFLLMRGGTFTSALLGGLAFGAIASLNSCMSAALAELSPTRTRYTGVAIASNLGLALFGGTAPLVATGLIRLSGDTLAPAFSLIGCAAVTGVTALFLEDRHHEALR